MDERELIKSKVDMVALVGETVELKKSGANWKGRCPFHSEKTPSFMVNPEIGIYKCFGCGEGGDCFSWLMKIEGLSFRESMLALAEKTGVTLSNKVFDTSDQEKQEILSCLEKASAFYKYILRKQEIGLKAREYLANRGITKEAQNEFGMGYAPEDWGVLLRMLGKAGISESVMEKAGLITGDGRKYDRFRARVTFELRNVRGQIVGLSGRIIEKNDKAPKYINSPETLVYHKGQMVFGLDVARNAIREKGRIIVVEGELDLVSSWQVGVKEIVALKGTAFTEDQVKLINRYTDKVILALDMDFAGDKAARKSIKLLHEAGMDVRMAVLPEGKDPDDVARSDAELWKKIVDEAVEVYKFLLDSAANRFDLNTAIGKQRLVEELAEIWGEIPNEILRSHWVGELARRVGVNEQVILKRIQNKGEVKEVIKTVGDKKEANREVELEDLLTAWMVMNKNKMSDWQESEIKSVWAKKIWEQEWENVLGWKTGKLGAELAENLKINMMKLEESAGEQDSKVEMWKKELSGIRLRRKIDERREELRKAESEENEEKALGLINEIQALTGRLGELRSG